MTALVPLFVSLFNLVAELAPPIEKLISDVRSHPALTPAARALADKMLVDNEALVDSHQPLPEPTPPA